MLRDYEISSVSGGNISAWSKAKCGEENMTQEIFNTKVERRIE